MSPASEAPWTLFWPRSGCSPDPGRPICPHISASEIRQRELSVPCTCWLTPMPQKIIAERAAANSRATVRSVSASMPQSALIRSGGKPFRCSRKGSQPLVKPATYCRSYSSSSLMTCMIALSMATSEPGLNCRLWRAWRLSPMPRGSIRISLPPRLANCLK